MDLITIGDFSISVKSIAFLMFTVFAIAAVGYLLGRITVKGVSLGTAGVFIVALLYGCFFYDNLGTNLMVGEATYVKNALKVVENMGLILFVTSVGFIAGPNFFGNFKKNFTEQSTKIHRLRHRHNLNNLSSLPIGPKPRTS